MHEIFHTRNGHTVAQRLVAGGIRRAGEVGPIVRESLEAFAFPRGKAPDEQRPIYHQFVLRDVLGVGAFAVAGGQCANGFLVDEISGFLLLAGALGGNHIVRLKFVAPLPRKNSVVIRGGQSVGDILLEADSVPAVLRLPVDGIPSDTDDWQPQILILKK